MFLSLLNVREQIEIFFSEKVKQIEERQDFWSKKVRFKAQPLRKSSQNAALLNENNGGAKQGYSQVGDE